jgi:phage terminase large subunit GpA-like protein
MLEIAKCRNGCQKPVHAHGLCQACYRKEDRRKKKERRDAELEAHYRQRYEERDDEMGIDRSDVYARLAKMAITMLQGKDTVDLKSWIEKNITLPVGNGYHGMRKMNFDIFPHMKDILKLIDNPECKRIVLCFAAQSGKSDTVASIAAYLSGYRGRRGLYVLPTANMLDKVRDSRLFPLLDASRKQVGFKIIENKSLIRFDNGVFFYLALASSPGTLAEQTGTSWVIIDEHDEFKQEGKGHNPVNLAEKRMQASPRQLTIIACTPKKTEIGYTYYYYNRTKRFIEEIQCPFCDGWFVPDFYAHFKWPEGEKNGNVIRENHLAWVECPECKGMIKDDMHLYIVMERKRWKDLDPDLSIAECGFRLPIFLTPSKNWSNTVGEYLQCIDNPYMLADFNNSCLAKPKDDENTRQYHEVDFSRLKGKWLCKRNEIPEGVHRLTAGVDVGLHIVWFVLLGWGNEGRKYVIRSEGILRGMGTESFAESMAKAVEMCDPAGYVIKGSVMPSFSGGLIDSGDGKDTEYVYNFCLDTPKWFPSKGRNQLALWEVSSLDKDKYRGKYGDMPLYLVDTNQMQNILRTCFRNIPGAPRSIQFAEDAPELLFQHIRNQQQYETRKRGGNPVLHWGKIGEKDDHLLDALMQSIFVGEILGYLKKVFDAAPPPESAANEGIIKLGNLYEDDK